MYPELSLLRTIEIRERGVSTGGDDLYITRIQYPELSLSRALAHFSIVYLHNQFWSYFSQMDLLPLSALWGIYSALAGVYLIFELYFFYLLRQFLSVSDKFHFSCWLIWILSWLLSSQDKSLGFLTKSTGFRKKWLYI